MRFFVRLRGCHAKRTCWKWCELCCFICLWMLIGGIVKSTTISFSWICGTIYSGPSLTLMMKRHFPRQHLMMWLNPMKIALYGYLTRFETWFFKTLWKVFGSMKKSKDTYLHCVCLATPFLFLNDRKTWSENRTAVIPTPSQKLLPSLRLFAQLKTTYVHKIFSWSLDDVIKLL